MAREFPRARGEGAQADPDSGQSKDADAARVTIDVTNEELEIIKQYRRKKGESARRANLIERKQMHLAEIASIDKQLESMGAEEIF